MADKTPVLETYEWNNVWWEHAGEREKPRLLYIGDSISCNVRTHMNKVADCPYYVDGFGSSKAVDNPYFREDLALFARQQGSREVILLNNGLHGWHLSTEQYAAHYEEFLRHLLTAYAPARVILLTTTAVENKEQCRLVEERNASIRALAQKHGLPVIDIYDLSAKQPWCDGVHFTPDGCRALAEHIVSHLQRMYQHIK